MKNKLKKLVAYILTMVMLLTSVLPAQVMAENNFADIEGNTYQAILQGWIDNGYINGYPDGTFRPDAPITRAEFMALVNRVLSIEEVGEINFFDVIPTDWFYLEVQRAFKKGYMSGSDNNIFPNRYITRQEFAVVLARLGALDTTEDDTVLYTLADLNEIPAWSRGAVSATLNANLFEGFITATNEFRPEESVSRLEVVVVLNRLADSLLLNINDEAVAQGPIVVSTTDKTDGRHRKTTRAVTSITVASELEEVLRGDTLQMTANILPENASNKEIVWSTETLDSGVATINENGLLYAAEIGTVKVIAKNNRFDVTGTAIVTIFARNSDNMIDLAVEAARRTKVAVSKDGKDILTTEKWVTEEEEATLDEAIAKALAAKADVMTEEEAQEVIDELNEAVDNYNAAKKAGLKADKSGLSSAITNAEGLYESELDMLNDLTGEKSSFGYEIKNGRKTVKKNAWDDYKKAVDEYKDAIDTAKEVLDDDDATQAEVDQAIEDLEAATEALEAAKEVFGAYRLELETARKNLKDLIDAARELYNNEIGMLNAEDANTKRGIALKIAEYKIDLNGVTLFGRHKDGFVDFIVDAENANTKTKSVKELNEIKDALQEKIDWITEEGQNYRNDKAAWINKKAEVNAMITAAEQAISEAKVDIAKIDPDTREALDGALEKFEKAVEDYEKVLNAIDRFNIESRTILELEAVIKVLDIAKNGEYVKIGKSTICLKEGFDSKKAKFDTAYDALIEARETLADLVGKAQSAYQTEFGRVGSIVGDERIALDDFWTNYNEAVNNYGTAVSNAKTVSNDFTSTTAELNAAISALQSANTTFAGKKTTFDEAERTLIARRSLLSATIISAEALLIAQQQRVADISAYDRTALDGAVEVYENAMITFASDIQLAKDKNITKSTADELQTALNNLKSARDAFEGTDDTLGAKGTFDKAEKDLADARVALRTKISDAFGLISRELTALGNAAADETALGSIYQEYAAAIAKYGISINSSVAVRDSKTVTYAVIMETISDLDEAYDAIDGIRTAFKQAVSDLTAARKSLADAIQEAYLLKGTCETALSASDADKTALAGAWELYSTAVSTYGTAINTAESKKIITSTTKQLNDATAALIAAATPLNKATGNFETAVTTLRNARTNMTNAITSAKSLYDAQLTRLNAVSSEEKKTALAGAWKLYQTALGVLSTAINDAETANTTTATATELNTARGILNAAESYFTNTDKKAYDEAEKAINDARKELGEMIQLARDVKNAEKAKFGAVSPEDKDLLGDISDKYGAMIAEFETNYIPNAVAIKTNEASTAKQLSDEKEKLEGLIEELENLGEQFKAAKEELDKAREDFDTALNNAKAVTNVFDISDDMKDTLGDVWDEYIDALDALADEIDIAEGIDRDRATANASTLNTEICALNDAMELVTEKEDAVQSALDAIAEAKDGLRSAVSSAQDTYDDIKTEFDAIEGGRPAASTGLRDEYDSYKNKLENLEEEISDTNAILGRDKETATQINTEVTTLGNKVTALENAKEEWEDALDGLGDTLRSDIATAENLERNTPTRPESGYPVPGSGARQIYHTNYLNAIASAKNVNIATATANQLSTAIRNLEIATDTFKEHTY